MSTYADSILKPELFSFLQKHFPEEAAIFTKQPILYLIKANIFHTDNVHLLEDVVFALSTDEEVIIDAQTVEQLKRKRSVTVIRLFDQQPLQLTYDDFKKQFAQSTVLDYVKVD